jgi:hypothetical protein
VNQQIFEEEYRDALRWRTFCLRFGRKDVMTDQQVVEYSKKMTESNGPMHHFTQLIEEGKRATRPAFLTGVIGAPGEPTKPSDHEKLQKLFAKL